MSHRSPSESRSESSHDASPTHESATRSYIRVHPSTTGVSQVAADRIFQTLHGLDPDHDGESVLDRLLGRSETPPTFEFLLVSPGESTASVGYYVGVDDADLATALERQLRRMFPPDYSLERTTKPDEWPIGNPVDDADGDDAYPAAVEYEGVADRHRDWQVPLTGDDPGSQTCHTTVRQADDDETAATQPLSAVVETMASMDVPMVYQVLLRPFPDWTSEQHSYLTDLEEDRGLGDWVAEIGRTSAVDREFSSEPTSKPAIDRTEALAVTQPDRSFAVNVRALAVAQRGQHDRSGDPTDSVQDPEPADGRQHDHASDPRGHPTPDAGPAAARLAVRELGSAFGDLGRTEYDIGVSRERDTAGAVAVADAIQNRTFHPPEYGWLAAKLPFRSPTSRGIVAGPKAASKFALVDGKGLTTTGARSLERTPGERTPVPRPAERALDTYRGAGLTLGRPLDHDSRPDDQPVAVPPSLQSLHVAWLGKTGAGKTTAAINALLDNHAATDGADILIEPKGDGMVTDYLRGHYARFGHLDDVIHFDLAELLPAFSFFDIRDELDAGVERTTAVEDTVDHYVEILTQLMGADQFNRAVRAPDVIRYLLKAMFDPVSGDDAFSHTEFQQAVRTMHERQSPPTVSDDELEEMLTSIADNRARTFDEIMAAVANRIEKIPVDRRLARIFNHVADPDDPGEPHIDLYDHLDEDVVIIFDTSGLRSQAQRAIAMVVLSNLWSALRRRTRRDPDADHPLVNLHVEEAASVAVSSLMQELLAQGRGFDLSVTLSMQFPGQLREADGEAYAELLNNVSTLVTGSVPVDERLTRRLSTDDMSAEEVGNRLRALRRGQWLVSLPSPFDEPTTRPFVLESLPLPPGHPEGDRALDETGRVAFDAARQTRREHTESDYGLTLSTPSVPDDNDTDGDEQSRSETLARVDSALPHTRRLPEPVTYDAAAHRLQCASCETNYDPDMTGMRQAITCCHSFEEVDRDDVPICDLKLKLGPDERRVTGYSDRQLMLLQAVYNAQQLRYQSLGYNLLFDSMVRLREYVDIGVEETQDLIDDGLLREDGRRPHLLYTVTPEGRELIGESHQMGVDYGHGRGDLGESSKHVMIVETARQYLIQEYATNPDSPVERVVPYYGLDERSRLDLAGVDGDGDVVIALEVERINNDVRRAAPDDFDKMADCDPEEAIWVVSNRDDASSLLTALHDPADDDPRIERTYSKNTPTDRYRIDAPGMTRVYTLRNLWEQLEVEMA